ncbi:Ankyrin repeat protein [Stieleria maiorica]|uniref:Ankyrin repeat protein n=1 Tax=Stieleria maiorica TaxID=2795974 RepID=A0A5B9MAT2_9BACT|nr:ankyrin repeat domain-containing protein [Stieleria maiorica]QEF98332.1 Ankyrin repeat protein [Stieleria maiorica]
MLRSNPIFHVVCTFAVLAMIALSGPVSARTPESDTSPGRPSHARAGVGYQDASHALLYKRLCELNTNWNGYAPRFEILNGTFPIDDEIALIQTHLKLVIAQLRSADISHLSDSQLAQRNAHLQILQTYMADGNFPQNIFVTGRRPVFIDPWGTHCAVGHLIATSGHSRLADVINREHRLDYLRDIRTAGLAQWQHASGFSLDELALIQPTYRSTTLVYPKEIEQLILGDSAALMAGINSGEIDVHARCGGKTLLHLAAAAGDLTLAQLLVDQGADLHAVSTLGCEKSELAKGGRQTVVTVRWDQPTSVTNRGGMGIGVYGAVFKTERGRFVADLFGDIRGGREGLNAFDYATQSPVSSWGYHRVPINRTPWGVKGVKKQPKNEILETLKANRAAVASWLKEQGVQPGGSASDGPQD